METGATMTQTDAIWLVDSPSEGELRVNPEAVDILASLCPPLKVVSIFGQRQSGKSHLLNILAGNTEFLVSSNDFPKSPGIFMRCLQDPHGTGWNLVLLDSEGFEEDLVINGRERSPVFTVCMLLSSVFLYNTWGPVNRDRLDLLIHITFLTNMASLPSRDGTGNLLPEFVWCVRDVVLDKELGSIEIMPADFLDAVLNDITEQESPSGTIKQLFPRSRMKLFDFCHPHAGGQDIGNLPQSELDPCFLSQVETLKKFLNRSGPKTEPDGRHTSGRELAKFLEQVVDRMSRGSIIHLGADMGECQAEKMEEVLETPMNVSEVKCKQPVVQMEKLCCSPQPKMHRDGRNERARPSDAGEATSGQADMLEPICLIENTLNNELAVNQKALDVLSSIQQPVVVVSIVGMYRTGKSYLMNRLAGKQTGFSLGSTIQSKTKGIWMWCVPHPLRKDQTLVLLDTEGLGDVEKTDQRNDTWIFALAVLLSSTLVYNSMGTINNEALMSLHYVTELTEHIKVKSNHEDEAESEYIHFFPSFVWAVRDFSLDLEIDGQSVTADQYLENSLKLKPGFSKGNESSNSTRECIRNYFPCRKCFVFDRPGSKDQLKVIDQLRDDELDERFVRQTVDFCSHVYNHSKEKTIKGGIVVTGKSLGNLAEMYVDAIQSGQIPCLENAVLALAKIENSSAVEKASALYRQLMGKLLILHTETQEEFSSVHEVCLKEALQLFMNRSFKDEDQRYQKDLMERIKEVYEKMCHKNEVLSKDHCTALLLQLEDSLEPWETYMRSGGYIDFKADLMELVQMYRNTPGKGIKAELVLEEYLRRIEEKEKAILFADQNLTEQERRFEEEQARAMRAREREQALQKEKRAMEQRVLDAERARRENERQLREKMERDNRAALQERTRVLDQKLKEQSALLLEGFNKKSQKMEAEIQELRRTLNQPKKEDGGGGWCVIS